MTLPEHLICSVMIAQLGCRQRLGWRAVPVVALAGISPDVDALIKLFNELRFWELHHALGHSLISIWWFLPQPTGLFRLVTGGWMYMAPGSTPLIDWW
jgi:hypothetical protein